MKRTYHKFRPIVTTSLITILLMAILLYVPSPFVSVEPGLAISTKTIVKAIDKEEGYENNSDNSDGQFLLTAILMKTTSFWGALVHSLNPDHELYRKSDILGDSSPNEYQQIATTVMKGSSHDALEAAYSYLNIAYEKQGLAVYISEPIISRGNQPLSSFQPGEQIIAIEYNDEKHVITSIEQLMGIILPINAGEQVKIHSKTASDQERAFTHTLYKHDAVADEEHALATALAVKGFVELRGVVPLEENIMQFNTDAKSVGGPSAGLVLALTYIELLSNQSLTKGYTIAATGTISPDGKVGAIGGIQQKVVSTDEAGADIFIVPVENEAAARKKVERIHSSMRIIAVSTLQEAMEAIASLEPKGE